MTDVIDPPADEPTPETPLVSLAQAKAHLRVDHNDDDVLIQAYVDAAFGAALDYCNRAELPEGPRVSAVWFAAVLLMVGDLYAFRETAQVGSVSSEIAMHPSARALLDPYRMLRV
ncbi:head-tail connector protein [uncultured Brevundimonas sp.]|uniref:head-tail connector protein n=1 Tax=uncultured Brevundimonas sp. TaxID=213418 RepID=UPI00260A1B23|nr:head-tail connector protein [uncultured Brevundimonas sp.]